ncbi:MAG: beta-phosphoglucomutase family hydrolase [Chitinophagaceae bacterium]
MHDKKAFLFDMDGTMMDNMQYHLQAWEKIVLEEGSKLKSNDIFKQLYGKNTEILGRILSKKKFSIDQLKEKATRKDSLYRQLYSPHIKLIQGLREFLADAKHQDVLLAIASGTAIKNVDFALDKLQIRDYFDVIVSGADVKTSKPDPETFLKAAEQLKVLPSDCIVFEDVPKGVEAAQLAGMRAIVVLTSHIKEEFAPFTNVIQTITDFRLLNVQELIYLVTRE